MVAESAARYRTMHVCRGGYTLGWVASAIGGGLITWLDPWWLSFLLAVLIYVVGLRFTHRNCHTEPAVACGDEAEGIGGQLRCTLDAGHDGWHKSTNGAEWREDHR